MSEVAVLYDSRSGHWLRFVNPVEIVEVNTPERVLPALAHLEQRVENDRLFAVGYVTYEAASAFDDALVTKPVDGGPLLRFVLFAKQEQVVLLPFSESPWLPAWQASESAGDYAQKVDFVRQAIARGETYQVNLTFPLTAECPPDSWQYFLQLAYKRKSPGAAFLQSEDWAICSISPELFFTRDGEQIMMRPMKGTAPRGRTLEEDLRFGKALKQSAKDRAENVMILDMVRNDLGRLAPPGQVHTTAICALEKYTTVWQLTSTATARSHATLAEIFQALFPCASITGAPKARTMQIIAAIETTPRNIYTGSIGWLGPGRQAHFNVAIRTVVIDRKNKRSTYGTGAGITWGSNSADEYRECLDKAAALSRPASDFALIETLRWTSTSGYFLLAEHLTRLSNSARYFDFTYNKDTVTKYLENLSFAFPATPQRVRLLLHDDGRLEATYSPLVETRGRPLKLRFASNPVDSRNILLFHKTTQRSIYESRLVEAEEADEVVLWNESGEVTECCTTNLVIRKKGRFLTPTLSCGLLPGTYRENLIQKGILEEAILYPDDLRECEEIFLVNAVRKWRRAVLCT